MSDNLNIDKTKNFIENAIKICKIHDNFYQASVKPFNGK